LKEGDEQMSEKGKKKTPEKRWAEDRQKTRD
jgi:hypothetical protein